MRLSAGIDENIALSTHSSERRAVRVAVFNIPNFPLERVQHFLFPIRSNIYLCLIMAWDLCQLILSAVMARGRVFV